MFKSLKSLCGAFVITSSLSGCMTVPSTDRGVDGAHEPSYDEPVVNSYADIEGAIKQKEVEMREWDSLVASETEALFKNTISAQGISYLALTGDQVGQPIGHYEMCALHENFCTVSSQKIIHPLELNTSIYKELKNLNMNVNEFQQIEELHEYYQTPAETIERGAGDCEDLGILKKHLFEQAGIPKESMAMVVVNDENGQGHAVLGVTFTIDDELATFIFDNKTDEIKFFHETPYTLRSMQYAFNPQIWFVPKEQRSFDDIGTMITKVEKRYKSDLSQKNAL